MVTKVIFDENISFHLLVHVIYIYAYLLLFGGTDWQRIFCEQFRNCSWTVPELFGNCSLLFSEQFRNCSLSKKAFLCTNSSWTVKNCSWTVHRSFAVDILRIVNRSGTVRELFMMLKIFSESQGTVRELFMNSSGTVHELFIRVFIRRIYNKFAQQITVCSSNTHAKSSRALITHVCVPGMRK